MMTLPQLIVRFKNQIRQGDIPLLVKTIAGKTLNNNDLFQKHIVSGNSYCYPFIQFKRINGQAAIVCIGEGTESIGGFFSASNGQLDIGGEATTEIDTVKAEKTLIQAWESNFTYTIRKYLPLSNHNYTEYQNINNMNESYTFIAQVLKANLLLFAKSIGIHLDRDINCIITELEEKAKVKYKNHTFVSFDLKFKTNLSLPNYIGLGIGVSHGFGTVVRVRG